MNLQNQVTLLKEQNAHYKTTIDLLEKRCEQYAQAYDSLIHQINELRRHRFGKRSERFIDSSSPQLDLFATNQHAVNSSTETPLAEATKEDELTQSLAGTKKKKIKTKKELPVRVEIIPVSEEQRTCSCGKSKQVIRYETKRLIHHQPAVLEILEQRREVVACKNGCEGELKVAPAPLHVVPKTKATEAFLAHIITSKLEDRQPLYHQEKQLLSRYDIDCSRQTMARWLIDLLVPLQPIINLLKEMIIDYDVAACDATTLQVLKELGRASETKSYVYCMRGDTVLNVNH